MYRKIMTIIVCCVAIWTMECAEAKSTSYPTQQFDTATTDSVSTNSTKTDVIGKNVVAKDTTNLPTTSAGGEGSVSLGTSEEQNNSTTSQSHSNQGTGSSNKQETTNATVVTTSVIGNGEDLTLNEEQNKSFNTTSSTPTKVEDEESVTKEEPETVDLFFLYGILILGIVVIVFNIKNNKRKKCMTEETQSSSTDTPLELNNNPSIEEQQEIQEHNKDDEQEIEKKEENQEIEKVSQHVDTQPLMEKTQVKWVVVGASVKGNGHIQSNMPCQDNNAFESFENGWGIAIVSDGAGSAAHSEVGSKVVVTRGLLRFKQLLEQEKWMEDKVLPTDIDWYKKAYSVLKDIRKDMLLVAQKNNVEAKSLAATCLVVIYSPYGLLTAHVGDGRMGYKTVAGDWKPMMTPHKGEEANQTIFMVSDFWSIPNYELSGVLVPETMVIREKVRAFALMSDGCENTSWQCTTLNPETGKYYDRNLPFAGFFDALEDTLVTFDNEKTAEEERQIKWFKFLENGTSGFVKEQDDKTMIYAVNVIS